MLKKIVTWMVCVPMMFFPTSCILDTEYMMHCHLKERSCLALPVTMVYRRKQMTGCTSICVPGKYSTVIMQEKI